ncbi:hypothetical protein [Lapidilactobacillus wuchangensis]|uniref:hypothetical protein n=1 Tax=Lapidilactobacillus wuchangensis TaxID=2486001 RepID=UPI0013DD94E5|nr:hypothetical protein [Lapidilactobacillus wuchangensis]
MATKSIITGLTTMIGFIVGFYLHKIFLYTMLGLAIGYLIVFWIPYAINWYKKRQ